MNDDLVEPDAPHNPEYRAIATHWAHGYEIQVVGVGITQTHEGQPETIDEAARRYVALMLNVPAISFRIVVEYS